MHTLVAFRCPDGAYILIPNTDSVQWFEDPSVEFLGDVRADSFGQSLTVARQIAKWDFALISKDEFLLSRSQTQEPLLAGGVTKPEGVGQSVYLAE